MKILHRKCFGHFFILIVFGLAFSTVFIYDSSLPQGIVTAKYFWFAVFICVVLLVLPFRLQGKNEFYLVDVLLGIFATYVCINWFFLNGNPDMHVWMTMLMIPLYVVVRKADANEKLHKWLLNIILVVSLTETLLGLLQLYGFANSHHSLYNITGTLFNPGPYSGFVAAIVPLALSHSLDKTLHRWERRLGMSTLFFALFALPATMSRAAWLAAFVGCMYVLWNQFRFSDFRVQVYLQRVNKFDSIFKFVARRVSNVVIRIILIIFTGFFFVSLLAGIYLMKKDSADGRRVIWSASMTAYKERPLFGFGYGRFTAMYGDAQAEYFLSGKGNEVQVILADSPDYAFNEYVKIAVELGIVGLALFLLTVGFSLFTPQSSFFAPRSSLLTLLVFAAFSYPFSVLPLSILFVFMLALSAQSSEKLSFTLPVWLRVVGITVCCGITTFGAYQILSKYSAYQEWNQLQITKHENTCNEAVQKYKALYSRLRQEKKFLFEYGQCLSKTGKYIESNSIFEEYFHHGSDPMVYNCMGNNYKKMGEFYKAENMYVRALQIVPNRHYPLYLLMNLYKDSGQTQKAKDMAVDLLRKPVKISSTAIREMREEARKIIITSVE